jgi:predicted permease
VGLFIAVQALLFANWRKAISSDDVKAMGCTMIILSYITVFITWYLLYRYYRRDKKNPNSNRGQVVLPDITADYAKF